METVIQNIFQEAFVDPIERTTFQIVSDCRPLEIADVMFQLREFIPPDMVNLYDARDARTQVFNFVRRELVTCTTTINLLIFEIIVTIVPGKSIDIFIHRKHATGELDQPVERVYQSIKL